jgi:hypothetical protein
MDIFDPPLMVLKTEEDVPTPMRLDTEHAEPKETSPRIEEVPAILASSLQDNIALNSAGSDEENPLPSMARPPIVN